MSQNLFPYQSTFEPPDLPSSVSASTPSTMVPHASSTALELSDEILDVVDDKFVTSHSGGYHRFLVRWKDRHCAHMVYNRDLGRRLGGH